MRRPAPRSHRWLFRALFGAFAGMLMVSGAAAPAAAAPPTPPTPPPPATLPSCKALLNPVVVTLFHSPVTELPPITLVATRDPVIKLVLYDNPVTNCRWTAIYGKLTIDFTLAYITADERAQVRDRWLTAYGLPGVNVGGDNWIYHRSTGGSGVESAALLELPYYLTAVANDGTYFPAFIQAEADQAYALLH